MATEYEKLCRQTNELGRKLKGKYGRDFTIDDLKRFADLNSEATLERAIAYQAEKYEKGENLDRQYEYQFIINSANEFANILTADSVMYEIIRMQAEKSTRMVQRERNIIFTPQGPLFIIGAEKEFNREYIEAGKYCIANFATAKKIANGMIDDVACPFFNRGCNRFYSAAAGKDLGFRLNSVVIGRRYRHDSSSGKVVFEPATSDVEKEITAEKSLYLQGNGRMNELIHNLTEE